MNNSKLQKDPGCKVDCEYAQKGKPVASIGALPIFFGNVIYSFEAIGMVTSPMRHRKFYKATGAANGKYDDWQVKNWQHFKPWHECCKQCWELLLLIPCQSPGCTSVSGFCACWIPGSWCSCGWQHYLEPSWWPTLQQCEGWWTMAIESSPCPDVPLPCLVPDVRAAILCAHSNHREIFVKEVCTLRYFFIQHIHQVP